MKRLALMLMLIVPVMLVAFACAEEEAAEETTAQPAAEAAKADQAEEPAEPEAEYSDPATRPAEPRVLAKVGDKEITSESIDRIVTMYAGRIPQAQLEQAKKSMIQQMILQELRLKYLETIQVTEEDLEKEKDALLKQIMAVQGITEEDLKNRAREKKVQKQATAEKAVEDVLKKAPKNWLDGTTVEARHILIQVPVYASGKSVEDAKKKLEGVAKQIEEKKLSFGEAAKQYSEGPSADKGGDLGAFRFDQMVLPFSKAAFALKAGETSDVVRSPFGVHLIQVTKVTPGEGLDEEEQKQIAEQVLMSNLQDKMIEEAMKIAPVVVVDEKKAEPEEKAKPEKQPTTRPAGE